jgi:hypothetical protein
MPGANVARLTSVTSTREQQLSCEPIPSACAFGQGHLAHHMGVRSDASRHIMKESEMPIIRATSTGSGTPSCPMLVEQLGVRAKHLRPLISDKARKLDYLCLRLHVVTISTST